MPEGKSVQRNCKKKVCSSYVDRLVAFALFGAEFATNWWELEEKQRYHAVFSNHPIAGVRTEVPRSSAEDGLLISNIRAALRAIKIYNPARMW